MRLRRRRAAEAELDLRDEGELATAMGRTFADDIESMGARLTALDLRLTDFERRLRDAEGATGLVPEHADVLDVQVRAAKLALDLHMVNLELERLKGGQ
jgi:predicted phage tail protein